MPKAIQNINQLTRYQIFSNHEKQSPVVNEWTNVSHKHWIIGPKGVPSEQVPKATDAEGGAD